MNKSFLLFLYARPFKCIGSIVLCSQLSCGMHNFNEKNLSYSGFQQPIISSHAWENTHNTTFFHKLKNGWHRHPFLITFGLGFAACSIYLVRQWVNNNRIKKSNNKQPDFAYTTQNCPKKAMNGELWPQPKIGNTIHFYDNNDTHNQLKIGQFTNTCRIQVTIAGKAWDSNERFFQAMKFTTYKPGDKDFAIIEQDAYNEIVNEKTRLSALPGIAKKFKFQQRKDWFEVNFAIMMDVLWQKFTQHSYLKTLLLATGNAILVEDTARARYTEEMYGAGKSYTGCNVLGQMLMQIRYALRKGNGKPKFTAHPPSFYQ